MIWTLVFAVAVVTAACGDSKSSLLPTAPSALSADAPSAATAAAGAYETTANGPKPGRGNGNENGNGNNNPRVPGNTSPAPDRPVPPGKAKVEFEGFVQAVGTDSLTVNGQKVMVTPETVIRHGNRRFALAEVNPSDRVHVRANRVVAAEVTLEATDVMVQKPGEAPLAEVVVVPDVLVSVAALDDSAFEAGVAGGDPAAFQLTRTGTAAQLAETLSVSFTLGGTATPVDYLPIALTATFPANASTVNVALTAVADGLPEAAESVVLSLGAGAGYEVGSPASATVMIADLAPPTVNVKALDADAEEINFNSGRLEISRTGDLSLPLTLTIQFSGSAEFNVDYRLSPQPPSSTFTFTMGPNQAVLFLTVNPVNDTLVESAETVVLSAVPAANYLVGTSGTVTIRAR
jgi:hypothetical protein